MTHGKENTLRGQDKSKKGSPHVPSIEEKTRRLPTSPGVYMMKGRGGSVLYIGKARNLRARVKTYFQTTHDRRHFVDFLVSKVVDIDYIITSNEKEALILEDTLLKKYRPRYNIRLKDDKTYVSIRITTQEAFSRILVTRQIREDGARYFGPYASAKMVRDTIKFLRRVFPLRVCPPHEFRNRSRPCIDYQLGLCSAPCVGHITEEAYRELVEGAVMFLEGRTPELIESLERKMFELSDREEFEEAARLRDRIHSIETTLEEQKVVTHSPRNQDVFGLYKKDGILSMVSLVIRDGRLVSTREFVLKDTGMPAEELLGSLLAQFYRRQDVSIPHEVLLPVKIDGMEAMAQYLKERSGRAVNLKVATTEEDRRLVELATINAKEAIRKKESVVASPLEELRKRLRLKNTPHTIEAFDISSMAGREAVGAMVTFRDGRADKNHYRLYRIRLASRPDDYAMLEEVFRRRYSKDEPPLPQLIVVDGGRGQLSVATGVLEGLGIEGVDVVALAKERNSRVDRRKGERVYLQGVKDPVVLREGTKGELLLEHIRDEVHRFAIGYHRKLRKRRLGSVLEEVPGVGEKRRKLLFEHFGDIEAIKKATMEELTAVRGITEDIARAIKERLASLC